MIVELNDIKYLPVEVLLKPSNQSKVRKLCDLYECIPQGISDYNSGGFLKHPFAIVKILVPEKNIKLWSKEKF